MYEMVDKWGAINQITEHELRVLLSAYYYEAEKILVVLKENPGVWVIRKPNLCRWAE